MARKRRGKQKPKEKWKNVFARHFGVQANLSVYFLVCLACRKDQFTALLHLTAVIIYKSFITDPGPHKQDSELLARLLP